MINTAIMPMRCLLLLLFLAMTAPAFAQGGNVFGPTVREGERGWEWRAMAELDDHSDISGSTRLHYQQAFNEAVRLRGLVQFAADPGESLSPQFARAELLWQYREETAGGYQAAFRFDARLSADGAHRLGVSWVHQRDFAGYWRVRAILTGDHEVGAGAADGVRISYRSRLSRRLHERLEAGIEAFGRVGNLADGLPGFDAQRHTIGPAVFGPINERWRWHVTSQFAISNAASDVPVRFRLYRRF
ncbi:hypothetical protein V0U79_10845 [Hyphobacterium sp. HN65]|uniref:DUF2490 domain-containing protein n=1 Tax=Hyphobacterium lacteum TaxID=3116575 RepID=A0ABU7LSJ3_9PROT|nr:hypothetical protein [Hyphobacterium sp. HN65]MEE2526868.1 hypothetical protein [Hyphobacterium sp. HN65]